MLRFKLSGIVLFLAVLQAPAQTPSAQSSKKLLLAIAKSKPDTTRINLLLKLADFEIDKPGEFKPDLDSAAAYLDQATLLNQKIHSAAAYLHIINTSASLARERGQKALSRAFAGKAIEILSKGANKYKLGQAYFALSECYNYEDQAELPKKIQLIKQAANVFKQGKYIEREAYCYQVLGDIGTSAAEGLHEANIALTLYQSIHHTQLQGLYIVISNDYETLGNYKQALDYGLQALTAANNFRDTSMLLCEINNHIGIIEYELNDYSPALKYFHASLATAETFKDVQTIYVLITSVCDTYMKLKQPREALKALQDILNKYPLSASAFETDYQFSRTFLRAYLMLKQFKLAKPYADHLVSISHNSQIIKFNQTFIYLDLAGYFLDTKQYANALAYLTKNDTLARELGYTQMLYQNTERWFELDTAQHNYKAAVSHLLMVKRLNDSLYAQNKEKEIQQLRVRFDTREKESRIRLLNKTTALDETKLQTATLLKNVTVGGIVLVLIIAGLLYRQNRLRRKNNGLITHKNELLQHLLTEKEWLLKEVHHRVKNNLHTVICLLESQARYLEDDALKAIENSQHRIYAMSLIHQKLYQSDDIKTIDTAEYIPELVESLEQSFDTSNQIEFKLKIDPVNLDISHAIPLGLIINEAVTNSIKYAFPDNRKGEISISLQNFGDRIKLKLADNGIGMPQIDHEAEPESMGLRLMNGLSEDIDADISFEVDNGVRISITFEHNALNKPENLLKQPQTQEIRV